MLTYSSPKAELVQNPDDYEVSRNESNQKQQCLQLYDNWMTIIDICYGSCDRAETYHQEATHDHTDCEETLHGPSKGVKCVCLRYLGTTYRVLILTSCLCRVYSGIPELGTNHP
jgi:hypothetical protein